MKSRDHPTYVGQEEFDWVDSHASRIDGLALRLQEAARRTTRYLAYARIPESQQRFLEERREVLDDLCSVIGGIGVSEELYVNTPDAEPDIFYKWLLAHFPTQHFEQGESNYRSHSIFGYFIEEARTLPGYQNRIVLDVRNPQNDAALCALIINLNVTDLAIASGDH